MDLDQRLSLLVGQLGASLPTLCVVVIAVIAFIRRDDGLWWKLVVAGAATLVLGTLVSVLGTFVVYGLDHGYRLTWLITIPTVLINAAGLALIGAGALVGRGSRAVTR